MPKIEPNVGKRAVQSQFHAKNLINRPLAHHSGALISQQCQKSNQTLAQHSYPDN